MRPFLQRILPVFAVIIAANVYAGISSSTGDVVLVTEPPASVERGDTESDTHVLLFEEVRNLILPDSLTLDAGASVRGDSTAGRVVPAGTIVNSYFLHADQTDEDSVVVYRAVVSTDEEILGVIYKDSGLDASDELLGASETSYPTGGPARGVETGGEDSMDATGSTTRVRWRR